ncbi:hypothetical protein ABEB36_008664 [Hypothenemus hampei]|uniref:Uncharacterized protein n=1 Tax=Hypothenemus hampei TaxID=57062 RepID=A0ABD1EMQ9_HYPHA
MQCAIILALAAVANAVPVTHWGGVVSTWEPLNYMQTPYNKQMTQGFTNQVLDDTVFDQLGETNEAIKDLQMKLQHHPQYWTVGHDAIHHLENDMDWHKKAAVYGESMKQLYDTVETGIGAQIVAHQVQEHGVPVVEGMQKQVFQNKLHKLIDEYNKQDIEKEIAHHHHCAQQLHEQEEFIVQQKHAIEIQKWIVHLKGMTGKMTHLDTVYHQLHMQELHLIKEQLAHHVAILELQKVLIHKEQQILIDVTKDMGMSKMEDRVYPYMKN